jgi:hypothetical protein
LAFFLDRLPKGFGESSDPKAAKMIVELKAAWNARVERYTDKDRAADQTMTWGMAGGGGVILIAIVTTQKFSPATWVAATCLSLAVPFLAVLGATHALQAGPKSVPPFVRDILWGSLLLQAVHFIFYVGFAAFLWSYDARIAVVFVIGSYLALSYFRKFAMRHGCGPQKSSHAQAGARKYW